MNTTEIIRNVIQYIHSAQQQSILYEEIYSNPDHIKSKHEFLFFIKPEITESDESIQLQPILEMLFKKLSKFELHVRNISVLAAAYLDKYNIIARHYGVINAMSRKPLEYLSGEAAEKFSQEFGFSVDEANILGSLEFLQHFPNYTPFSLDELWQNSQATKLAGGTYCAAVTVRNEKVFLINGFHPRQLIHFTEKGRSIIAFTLTGDLDWSVARNAFIGKTNPADAAKGSLRNDLLQNHVRYGVRSVSPSRNGFHLSAGPVEGLVELIRYCSDFSRNREKTTEDFIFGRQLMSSFTDAEIGKICENSLVTYNGKSISVFDLTEEKNNDSALEMLKECTL